MTASNETRGRFVKEAVRSCLEHRFDGIDLDWEHPAGAAEQQNYSKLLADLNAAFREHGLSLSVTMASWQHLPPAAFQHVDAVQIMSYDHGGRHSTIENSERDIQSLMKMGVPSQKLILGVPFYGRGVKDGGRTLTYAEIVRKHAPGPADDEVDGLYFNGPQTIERKVKLAETAKLGGVMIWELGQDAPGEASLLRVIRRAVPAASSP